MKEYTVEYAFKDQPNLVLAGSSDDFSVLKDDFNGLFQNRITLLQIYVEENGTETELASGHDDCVKYLGI